ncbi:MAG: hypothetical protein AAFP19_10360 [Bacteroidota bacterium]
MTIQPSDLRRYSQQLTRSFSKGPLLKGIGDIDQPDVLGERVFGISGARVVFANYPLLQHDIPILATQRLEKKYPGLRQLSPQKKRVALQQKIDEWLIENTAYISERQTQQSLVNSPIPLNGRQIMAWRPPRYGRALVFSTIVTQNALHHPDEIPLKENRILDVKGTGVAPDQTPSTDTHGNGLLSLSDALLEFLNQQLIQGIFRHSGSAFETIPIYGILDLGFDIVDSLGRKMPAGMMIRRAHQRPKNSGGLGTYGSDEQHVQLAVELLLRKYGISSVNNISTIKLWKEEGHLKISYGRQKVDFFTEEQIEEILRVSKYRDSDGVLSFDGVNVQHTREIKREPDHTHLVDFGTYRIWQRFRNPILSLVADKLLRWGGSIWPRDRQFTQPDPRVCVPFEYWGAPGSIWGYSRENDSHSSKQDILCDALAKEFRENKISRSMLMGTLQTYLETATSKWID